MTRHAMTLVKSGDDMRKSKLVQYDVDTVEVDALRYLRAHPFLERLKQCTNTIGDKRAKDLRRQALSGDVEGAEKALELMMGWRGKPCQAQDQ